MENNKGPSIYIPSDKNIYDALQHKKIRHSDIINFLRNRGILLSLEVSKDELSKVFSNLTIDYHDYLLITKLLENPNRKEKTTRATFKTSSDDSTVLKACQKIAKLNISSDSYKVVKREGSTVVVVTYVDIDFTKTELRQKSTKQCEVEIQTGNNEITVRMPANKKGKEISDKIKNELSTMTGSKIEEEVISLENITDAEDRTLFFYELIRSIPNYKIEDVSTVDFYHDISDLNEESEDEEKFSGFIRKAVLAGGGVLESPEFNQLHSRGFFISRIVWTVVDEVQSGDKVELEAQFGNPSNCTDFKYLVRGIYNYNDNKIGYNLTRRSPSKTETNDFNNRLEKSAKIAFDKVIEKYVED